MGQWQMQISAIFGSFLGTIQQAVASIKKNAKKRGQTIVFVDESGLSERPTRVRTWAPRGQTPVLQYSFSWKQAAGIGLIAAGGMVAILAQTSQVRARQRVVVQGLQ